VSPPRYKTTKADPKIYQVVKDAEQNYFMDKMLQRELIEEKERE